MRLDSARRRAVDAILFRGRALRLKRDRESAADEELLGELADGRTALADVDDETLERLLGHVGADAIIEALLAAPNEKGAAAPQAIPRRQLRSAKGGIVRTFSRPLALAASLVVVVAAVVYFLARPAPQRHAEQRVARAAAPVETPALPTTAAPPPANVPSGASASAEPAEKIAVRWSPQAFGALAIAHQSRSLPQQLPDFNLVTQTRTLGGSADERHATWRTGTVIVRSAGGWGSGALISADGWLLTNYHVVEGTAQADAVSGRPTVMDVITGAIVDGRIKPQPAVKATLYRVDPVHDLALLKIDARPGVTLNLTHFDVASDVHDGEDCFVIGSQGGGPAWWVRQATVSQQFDFPEDLSQFAAGVASQGSNVDRARATVIVTDARVSPGDSGGPLLNTQGQLIGLTFATPANTSAGSVGWHIALPHVRQFIASMPAAPEHVPFDPWTAGLPTAATLEPELGDGDRDDRVDSLRYRYALPSESGEPQPAAMTLFVDFAQRSRAQRNAPLSRVPFGLWGMEDRGGFHFNVFVTTRADGVAAVGYTNAQGIVDEIRIAEHRGDMASVVWRRDAAGRWRASRPESATPLVDESRFTQADLTRLLTVTGQLAPRSGPRPPSEQGQPRGGDRNGINKVSGGQ